LPEQVERPQDAVLLECVQVRECAQIEVEGGEVVCRPLGRAAGLGRFQGRLDDAGDADRYLVLKLEHVFKRAVEPVCPKRRAPIQPFQ
jgi:hypothetical protein